MQFIIDSLSKSYSKKEASYVPYPLNKVSVSALCMMTVVGIFG